ncbi:MAG: PEP-CTERM sorting domain-containing protein [Candidatus Brocadiae bacterium]|nr:PEP-CTERM sorting domain-containing protein [Candidatus Brocadiia bacterium]
MRGYRGFALAMALALLAFASTASAVIVEKGADAHFIQVENNGGVVRLLHVAEIEAFIDDTMPLANMDPANDAALSGLGASVYSASTGGGHGNPLATIDGAEQSAAATWTKQQTTEPNAQITIDLGSTQSIGTLRVHQRTDTCCNDRLSNFTVRLYADDGAGNPGTEVYSRSFPGQAPSTLFAGFDALHQEVEPGGVGAIGIENVTTAHAAIRAYTGGTGVDTNDFHIGEIEAFIRGTAPTAGLDGANDKALSGLGATFVTVQQFGGGHGLDSAVINGVRDTAGNTWDRRGGPVEGLVTLDTTYDLGRVRVWQRNDGCCQGRLSNFTLAVLNAAGVAVFSEYHPGTVVPTNSFTEFTIPEGFTLAANDELNIDINALAGTSDLFTIDGGTGNLNIASGAVLNVTLLDGLLVGGSTFDIIDAAAILGTFDTINLPGVDDGVQWDLRDLYTEGVIFVQPEPCTLGLLALGGLGLWRRRRRTTSKGGSSMARSPLTVLILSVALILAGTAGTATATITVLHQYDIGDGADAGTPGGPAPTLNYNVGAVNMILNGPVPTFSGNKAIGAFYAAGSTMSVDLTAAPNSGFYQSNLLPGVTSNYGVDLWVNTNATSQATNIFFPNGWEFGTGTGKGGLGIQQSGNSYQVIAPGIYNLGGITATPGQWTHLAAVLVGTNQIRLYADGVLVRTQTATPNHVGTATHLGVNAGGAAGFDGLLDHARAFTFAAGAFTSADLSLNRPNLLEGGSATQSNTWTGYPASNAIDNIVWEGDNTTHTADGDTTPWWQGVMTTDARVQQVVLTNRPGCCQDRLRDLFLEVRNAGGDLVWTSPEINDGNVLGSPQHIYVDIPDYVRGDRVRVRRVADGGDYYLALGEVQSFGVALTNVALGKPATQSSNYNSTFVAGLAVDGNYNNFTHTNGGTGDMNPWLVIDLGLGTMGNGYDIESIVLHNRDDCCGGRLRDITVEVLDAQMNNVFTSLVLNPNNVLGGGVGDFGTGPAFLEVDLLALLGHSVRGSMVRISRTGTTGGSSHDNYALALGEVQVFGMDATPEPGTLSLLALGGLGLWRRRRRTARH